MQINKPAAIVVFLIIIAILVFLFVIPKYQQYHQLQTKILQKEAELSGQSMYYARIMDILLELQTRKQALTTVDSALPADFSLAPVVDFLQAKGSENGVTVQSVAFSKNVSVPLDQTPAAFTPGQIKDIPLTLTATGSYQGLKNFLVAMDNSARIFEMDSVSFSPAEGATAKNKLPQYVLKLEVRTHSY